MVEESTLQESVGEDHQGGQSPYRTVEAEEEADLENARIDPLRY
jgi:hypothetical protein